MAGIFGEFFVVSVPPGNKSSGKFGAFFGAKFGFKSRKIQGLFVLHIF